MKAIFITTTDQPNVWQLRSCNFSREWDACLQSVIAGMSAFSSAVHGRALGDAPGPSCRKEQAERLSARTQALHAGESGRYAHITPGSDCAAAPSPTQSSKRAGELRVSYSPVRASRDMSPPTPASAWVHVLGFASTSHHRHPIPSARNQPAAPSCCAPCSRLIVLEQEAKCQADTSEWSV